eukprot:TRINITY_DN71567_c0_g1_i1.p1 TRINITY_DN71567_c0_g1~~TRINITY_DN71567_c0_g1_i1.p1  ORF type:complete len:469 (+),score=126.74 TRINITY_DN71567_c0_g1_i1:36-1409(+)
MASPAKAAPDGMWEVDVVKPKVKTKEQCSACEATIAPGSMRFKWFPFGDGDAARTQYDANCAVLAHELSRRTLRRSSGLTRDLQQQLSVLLEGAAEAAKKAEPSISDAAEPKLVAVETSKPSAAMDIVGSDVSTPKGKKEPVAEASSASKTTEDCVDPIATKTKKKKAEGEGGPAPKKAKKAEKGSKGVPAASPAEGAGAGDGGSKAKAGATVAPPAEVAGAGDDAQVARLTDLKAEPLGETLGPIIGVMDVPRMSLIEAAVATGVSNMDACAFMASEHGQKLCKSQSDGLDADEAGALNLYTMESDLYPTMNRLLRSKARSDLKPFFPFLQLMLLARAKLPSYSGTVWRGVKADLRKDYVKGSEVYWWSFSSTTKELSKLTNPMFLGAKGTRTIFNIQVLSGSDITRYSIFQGPESEAEVLLYPGTKFRVVDQMDMGHKLYQIHLQEVPVPVKLMK